MEDSPAVETVELAKAIIKIFNDDETPLFRAMTALCLACALTIKAHTKDADGDEEAVGLIQSQVLKMVTFLREKGLQ